MSIKERIIGKPKSVTPKINLTSVIPPEPNSPLIQKAKNETHEKIDKLEYEKQKIKDENIQLISKIEALEKEKAELRVQNLTIQSNPDNTIQTKLGEKNNKLEENFKNK